MESLLITPDIDNHRYIINYNDIIEYIDFCIFDEQKHILPKLRDIKITEILE